MSRGFIVSELAGTGQRAKFVRVEKEYIINY
jgi:hypothetical protein